MKKITASILLFALIAFGGCADPNNKKSQTESAMQLISDLNEPITLVDMLNHLKFALDHHLFIKDDFYDDENLVRFFGAEKMNWLVKKTDSRFGSVLGLKRLVDEKNRRWCSEISAGLKTVNANREVAANGKLLGFGGIQTELGNQLTAERIEDILGVPTEIVDPFLNSDKKLDVPLDRPTHKLGNRQLQYKYVDDKTIGIIAFLLRGDGTVNRINYTELEK